MIVAGVMSGTSMDGIDVAAADLRLEGDVLVMEPLGHRTLPYSDALRAALAGALPPARTTLETVCRLDTLVGQEFAEAAAAFPEAELVVSHGQTVFHWVEDGRVRGTLQIGQPAWIAERTGRPVVSDLRSADVAAGGQGAPLVSLFDVLLLGGGDICAAALNLGGIANLTIIPERGSGTPLAFDVGPANALLDAAAVRVSGGRDSYDAGGRRAAAGTVNERLLAALARDPYYGLPPPKTTGKEHFNGAYLDALLAEVGAVSGDDLLATLTVHTAVTVAAACRRHAVAVTVAAGGGTANPVLMDAVAGRLAAAGCRLERIDDYGIPSRAKEAYAFAVLGFLSLHGLAGTIPSCTGARRAAVLGRITPGPRPLRWPPPAGTPPTRLRIR